MKLLIAYDGSECADAAVENTPAAGLPDRAEAIVLSVGEVWDLPAHAESVAAGSEKFVFPITRLIDEHLREIEEKNRKLAEMAAARVKEIFPDWRVSAEAVCGKPAIEIIKRADQFSPDLLIVGSHGRSALGRAILGSVSHKILHEARSSVRISRRCTWEDETSATNRVLIAVDGSANAETTVKAVAARQWPPATEFRLIAVNDPFTRPPAGYVGWNLEKDEPIDTPEASAWIEKVIEAPRRILSAANLEASHNIRWGDAAAMILREAEDWRAHQIFLGARGLGRVKRFLLGSVSSAVAAQARCTVEVVRQPTELSTNIEK